MTEIHSQESHPVQEKRMQEHLDYDMSLLIALIIRAQPNSCFENVLDMFLQYFPDEFAFHGQFVEGWYVVDLSDEVVVNEHGWCELPNGNILDPTVTLLVSPECPVYYFPGVKRSWQEVKALVQNTNAWFPYVRGSGTYGEDGLKNPAYKAAYEAAIQKVHALANATEPPKKTTFLTAQEPDQAKEKRSTVRIIIIASDPEKGAR